MSERGRFITIEGSEGVGKSTNAALVQESLEARGKRVLVTREPGGTPLAEAIRELLLRPSEEVMAPLTELLLVFSARAQHLEQRIRPALANGQWVVCDRFTDATFAYQGGGRGLPIEQIAKLEALVHADLQPELTLLLDVPVAVALERIAGREHDRFEREQEEFFLRVREHYRARAATHERFVIVDASQALPRVGEAVKAAVDQFVDRIEGP